MTKRLVCGIGVNDANYPVVSPLCKFYRCWASMLNRCYSKNWQNKYPTYIGCTVAPKWHSFMNFRSWMMSQDWEGKHLDKDIIEPGNKIYGPETCVFVSTQVNNILTKCSLNKKTNLGSFLDKQNNKFTALCRINSKQHFLGQYDTAAEASKVYREFKAAHLMEVANEQSDFRIRDGLIKHAGLMSDLKEVNYEGLYSI